MITRISGATSTLAANPRRKKHNPRRRKAKKHNGVSLMKNASHRRHKRKAHNPMRARRRKKNPGLMSMLGKFKRKAHKRKSHRRSHKKGLFARLRNPGSPLVIAGVPVVEMAIGSVVAIGAGHLVDGLIAKYAPQIKSSLPGPLGDVVGEVAVAGLAALAYTKLAKSEMTKNVAKFVFIGAVFQLLSKVAEKPIADAINNLLPGGSKTGATKGYYFDPYAAPSTSGLYLDAATGAGAVGGMYAHVEPGMSGLNLFKAPSIYG